MLPLETILAVFPGAVRVKCGEREVELGPMTLSHATALEALGVGTAADIRGKDALLAAFVMSCPPDEAGRLVSDAGSTKDKFHSWLDENADLAKDIPALVERLNALMDMAYLPYVPASKGDSGMSLVPTGFGWTLEYAEIVCHEYGWSWECAMATPIARIFGLVACAMQRRGGSAGGPDYYERIMLKAIEEAKAQARAKAKGKEAKHG